jgi:hypothetical protein
VRPIRQLSARESHADQMPTMLYSEEIIHRALCHTRARPVGDQGVLTVICG